MRTTYTRYSILLGAVVLVILLISCVGSYIPESQVTDENPTQEEDQSVTDFFRPEIACNPRMGEVVVYSLSKRAFTEFLTEPSVELLCGKSYSVNVFRKASNNSTNIEVEGFGPSGSTTTEDAFFWLFPLKIDVSLIEFVNAPTNFEQILSACGVFEKMLSYVFISHRTSGPESGGQPPPGTYPRICIWIRTDSGDYFLENLDNQGGNGLEYDFYDLTEFSQMYER